MTDIFSEIEEDIRRDRVTQLWRRYGAWVIAAAVLIVLATIVVVVWDNYRQRQQEALGDQYSKATVLLRDGSNPKAIDALKDIAAKNASGYGLLARIQAATLQADGTGPAKTAGLDTLDSIAGDGAVPEDFRNLARLLWGLHGVDTLPRESLIASLKPLTIAPNPWRFTATELTALADIRAGDKKTALTLYKSLADDLDAPQSLRARAAEIVTDLQN